jgi:hypothetical protein
LSTLNCQKTTTAPAAIRIRNQINNLNKNGALFLAILENRKQLTEKRKQLIKKH